VGFHSFADLYVAMYYFQVPISIPGLEH